MNSVCVILHALVCFLSLTSFATTFAQQTARVDRFTELHLADNELFVSYEIGGGCATHQAEFYIELAIQEKVWTAKVHVFDTADQEDLCESLITVTGQTNLAKQIAKAASQEGLSQLEFDRIRIQLPSSRLTLPHGQ